MPSVTKKTTKAAHINQQGTGLGLVLVKDLVVLNNGKIEAQSVLNQGTTFTITFS